MNYYKYNHSNYCYNATGNIIQIQQTNITNTTGKYNNATTTIQHGNIVQTQQDTFDLEKLKSSNCNSLSIYIC
jgi:hypothetical protein